MKPVFSSQQDFTTYVKRHNITDAGSKYLSAFLKGPFGSGPAPSRAVRGRIGNVIVRYPSSKNGCVLATESRRVEFAICLQLENDPDVVRFLSQPPPLSLSYDAMSRRVTVDVTPDFLVLYRTKGVCLVDAKLSGEMDRLCKSRPGRWVQTSPDSYKCPPGDAAAAELGFTWRVWTDAEYSPVLIQNLLHLDPYLKLPADYFAAALVERLRAIVNGVPGITVDALAERIGPEGQALARWAIAHQCVYADLNAALIAEQSKVPLFSSREIALAAEVLNAPITTRTEERL